MFPIIRYRFASSYGPKQRIHERYNKKFISDKNRIQSGGGGLVSTAQDYMNFCTMLLQNGSLMNENSLRRKRKRDDYKSTSRWGSRLWIFGFGLGFQLQLQDWGDKAHAGEYSWNGAASTHFWISPKDNLIVIALTQREPYSEILKESIKPVIYNSIKK